MSSISLGTPQVPTKVEGDNPVESGYITYTDYIGEYMEVDSVKTLLWAGKEFTNPQVSGEGNDVTYTFSGEIQNPAYENAQNANQIQITVHTNTAADGTKTQTLTVKIPATAIPLRVNTVELSENAQGETTVVSNTSNNAYPLRLVYGVSLQDGIDPTTLEGVSDEYITANTENGKVNFYSNKYTGQKQGGKTVGDAKVEFTPADNNPFYFLQENTPIYTSQTGNDRVTRNNFNENATYWVPVTYYDGNQIVNTRVARAASTMTGYIGYENPWDSGYAYIEAGAPRLGNLTDVVRDKGTNTTVTAETSLYPTFEGDDVHDGKFVVYLGNNGKLQLDAPASLIIAKGVTADEDLTAPDATFTFEVTSAAKENTAVSATITTGSGQTATTEDTTVQFNADGVATVTLKADQSIELKGMAGAEYSIKETNLPSGFDFVKAEGADQTTGSGNDTVASGNVVAGDDDETVTFTNNYSVKSATSEDLGIDLSGTKTIDGRSFQEDDTFTFTIAAGQLTPNAPLPSATEGGEDFVTITPNSGDSATFEFDPITFTEPGEYCYIIRENDPTAGGTTPEAGLGGVDYDTAVYRISVVIVDNGDGTLRLATTDEIAGMETQVENYTSNPMIQVLEGTGMTEAEAIQFDNSYNSESTTAIIQGMKVLNVSNSDYRLQDGDFTFNIELLGSNTDGGDQFTADETQPKPVDQNGNELTQTTNVANGNVRFDFAEDVFTQDMVGKTFGYKITEVNPSPEGSIMSNGVTYDTREQIVKITVANDGHGNVIARVTPNTADEGDPAVNFTFTNSYEPEETTIGDQTKAGITVQKTFTGHEWTAVYSFEYTLKAVSNTAGIEVANMPMPSETELTVSNPQSGTVNTNAFGEMTFERAGEYVYEITEANGGHGGVTYDSHTAKVTVVVSENAETGKLSATIQYDNSTASEADKNVENAAAFTNTYNATFDNSTAVSLDGTKNLTVGGNSPRTLGAGQFYAVVTALDGAPLGDAGVAPGATTYNIANTADESAEDGVFTGSFENLLDNITFKLSDLNGAASRDFVYLISEQQGNATGVTYDQSVYQVTVTVTDDGEGTLSASDPKIVKGTMQDGQFVADQSQDGVDGVVFNNSYEPTSDTYAPWKITKALSGDRNTPLQAGEFSFEMSVTSANPQDGITLPQPTVVENAADGSVQFGNITFTKVGTYVVQVKEVVPTEDSGERVPGVTYDEHVITSTFTVRDVDGKLVVSRTNSTGSTTFTNEYTSTGTTDAALSGTKYISGRDFMKGDTFTFDVIGTYDGDVENVTAPLPENVTASEDNAAQGTITITPESGSEQAIDFGTITFTKPGTYTYTVSEHDIDSSVESVTKDSTVYTVTYAVEDNGDGTMTVSGPTYMIQGAEEDAEKPTALVWKNTYTASGELIGEANLAVTKNFTGRPAGWLATDEFSFQLTADMTDSATKYAVDNGYIVLPNNANKLTITDETAGYKAAFGNIKFTETGNHTYKFIVNEIMPEGVDESTSWTKDGITYDHTPRTVIVNVVDDGNGKLTASIAQDSDSLVFNNVYTMQHITFRAAHFLLQGDKVLDGRDWEEGDEFTFTLTAGVGTNVDQTEMPRSEVAKTLPSKTTDTIKPFEDDSKVTDNTAQFTFTSDRIPEGDIVEEDTFTFTKPGTYRYLIQEVNPNQEEGGQGILGVTYDQTTYRLTVEIVDRGDGTLELKGYSYSKRAPGENTFTDIAGSNEVVFTNRFSTDEVGVSFNAAKVLNGRGTAMTDGEFTFTMTFAGWNTNDANPDPAVDANWLMDGEGAVDQPLQDSKTATNIIRGDVTFADTFFTHTNVGKTYRYAIVEKQPTVDGSYDGTPLDGAEKNEAGQWVYKGVAYDNATKYVTAKVTSVQQEDPQQPGVQVEVVKVDTTGEAVLVEEGSTDTTGSFTGGAIFTNTYSTTGTLKGDEAISVTKIFTGRENDQWLDTDTFQAMLTAVGGEVDGQTLSDDNVPMPDGRTGGAATVDLTKDAHENVAFGEITYSRPGTYIYTLTEVEEHKLAGVEYSQAEYEVVVTAEDNHDGTMTVISKITPVKADNGTEIENAEPISGAAEFTNTYSVAETSIGGQALAVTKNLSGRSWFDSDEFTFTLAAGEDNGVTQDAIDAGEVKLPAETEITISGSTEGHTVTFDAITFTKAGTYTFKVTESGKIAGVTNDEDVDRTFVVSVVDNNDGTLTASIVAEQSENLVFNNTYKAEPVTLADVTVQKTLVDRNWAEGEEYTFTIVNTQKPDGVETAPMPVDDNGNVVDTITVGKPADGNMNTAASFGKMTFSQAGTYVYEIKETAGTDETMTYDGHTAVLTVNVFEMQTQGKLYAVPSYDNTGSLNANDAANTSVAAFTNTQKLETTLDITGTKEIAGDRNFQTGDSFTFTVTADNGAPMPNGVDENGTITITPAENTSSAEINFGTITFTQAGEYVYHIVEVAGKDKDMTYDTAVRDIIVTVTNDNNGHLDAKITTGADQLTWTNTWTFPSTTYAGLNGTKNLTGKELTEGMFTFQVKPQNDAPMGETLGYNVNGDAIQGEDGVWSASITLLKNIPFDKVGEYTYIITEKNDGQGGITYDTIQYRVTLTVKWDGNVSTKIEQSANGTVWADAANGIVFNNSYATEGTATLDGATALAGTKTLSGRDWTDTDSFTFILEMTEGNTEAVTMPGDLLAVVQGAYSDGAQVPFSFGDITFSQEGDYTFTIREQQPGEEGFVGQTGGMAYDTHTRTIKVNVFDNGAGKLEAKVVSDEGGSNWTNVYDANTPAELIGATNLAVTKVIDGRDWLDTDSFTFMLIPGDKETEEAVYGNEAAGIAPTVTMPVGEDASITITSATENHTNSFGNITFTEPGNYSFKIAEEGEDHDGLVYDKDVRTIEVSVTDNLDGTLSAKVVGITPEAGLTFTNKYDTTGDEELDGATNLAVVKNLTGRDWQEGDVFTFQLAAGDGDTVSAIKEGKVELSSGDTTEQITVTNEMVTEEGVHTNHFGSIKFHEVGTYTFRVTEQPSTMPGVTNDADADRTVVVSVVDNNAGELVASVVADKSEQLTFTNTYKPGSTTTGEGSVSLSGKKVLNGRDLVAGEFTFLITAGDDATSAAIADGTVVLPVENPVNKADGSFSFGDVTFDAAGTYVFNIAEMAPRAASETGTFNGITYDPTVYTVTIEVKDNTVAGKLEVASVTGIPEGGMVFTNTFTPQGQSTAVVPSITKNYTGHDLAAGQGDFAFKVVNNADANDVYNGIVKMTKAGTATVDVEPIYYDADDMAEATMDENGLPTKTFTYTISEVNGGKDGVEYDKTTYTMTVVVSVNADGSFAEPVVSYANAEGDALEGGVVFNNSYSAANPASYRPYGTKATIAQDDTKDNTNLNAMRFSFEVVDAENEIVSVGTSNANGDITFEPIDNIMGEGTHTYTIREVSPDTEGLTMDTTTYTLTLEVADDGAGSFYVVPGSEVYTNNATDATSNGANFTNVYNGGVVPLVLSVTKDLDGRALNAGEFGFTLYDYTGDVKGAPLAYGVNDAEGDVTFGSINYYYDKVVTTPEEDADQADQTEETTDADQAEDQTPDEGEQTGEGTEITTPEMPDASGDGTAADNQPETGTGSVTDEGATDQTGNGEQTGDVSGEGAGTTTPETPDASGEATGDGMADTGTTDQGATGTTDVPGATEETAPVEETPAATEEVATESEAPAEVATLSDEPTNPAADVASFLAPEIAIADDVATEQYELEPLPETVVVDETAAAESTGATTAEPVEQVVSTDLGWHRYLIEENVGDLGGVSYDQSKFIVDVLVSDKVDENGVPVGEIQATVEKIVKVDANYANPMEVTVSGGDGMDNVVFYNTYKVTEPSYVTITGTKTLTGRAMTENDKFTFSVYDANGNEVATGISKADGSIDFTSIEVNGAAESTYTVKENHAGETINGVTYSEQVFEFTIKSWDNGNGGWDYEVVYPEGGIAFTNDYSIQGDGILVGFEGTKTLTGRDMKADEFGFAVYDANGEKVAGGQNTAAADGEASALELGKVTITEPGEYEYTIAENAGTAGGVTYDGRTFTAQVKVWDNGMGALEYEVTYPDGPVAFENTYGLEEGAKVEVTPVATKTLTGRALADGEFTFAVTDADGKTVSTGTNDASGNVNFTPITFTETGTYTYTISEVNGRQDTITYDDATFGLVVTIADDGQGGLVAADVNYANGTPAFANVYEEPEKPVDPKPAEPEVPKTGDDGMNLAGAAALGLGGLGAALVGGGALLRRRASR